MRDEKEIEDAMGRINDLANEYRCQYKYYLYRFSLLHEIRQAIHDLNSIGYDGKIEVEIILRWVLGEIEKI